MQLVDIPVIIINYISVRIILKLVCRHIQVNASVIDKGKRVSTVIVVNQRVGISKQFRNRIFFRFYNRHICCCISDTECRIRAFCRYIIHSQSNCSIFCHVIIQFQFQLREQTVVAVVGIPCILACHAEFQLMVRECPGRSSADIFFVKLYISHIKD